MRVKTDLKRLSRLGTQTAVKDCRIKALISVTKMSYRSHVLSFFCDTSSFRHIIQTDGKFKCVSFVNSPVCVKISALKFA